MDEIFKEFLQDVNDIENSDMFYEDDIDEPTEDWVEEIDSRTNYPFYWNSKTSESVWDKPEAYDEYLLNYEKYLRNKLELESLKKTKEHQEEEIRRKSEMKGLLSYSDSEDEEKEEKEEKRTARRGELKISEMKGLLSYDDSEDEEKEEKQENLEIVEPYDDVDDVEKVLKEIKSAMEEEESVVCKKKLWFGEQVTLAMRYLEGIVKEFSETAVNKVDSLSKIVSNGDTLSAVGVRIQTRLEDWLGGYLTIERTVEKLKESLITISQFEGDLESINWKLRWDSEKLKYYFMNTKTGMKKWYLSNGKYNYEDGEIVEDEDDLTSDLRDYVTSTLHRSLLEIEDDGEVESKVDIISTEINNSLEESLSNNAETLIKIENNKESMIVDEEKIEIICVEKEKENYEENKNTDEPMIVESIKESRECINEEEYEETELNTMEISENIAIEDNEECLLEEVTGEKISVIIDKPLIENDKNMMNIDEKNKIEIAEEIDQNMVEKNNEEIDEKISFENIEENVTEKMEENYTEKIEENIIDNKKENFTEKMKENFNEKIEENIIDNKEENYIEKIEENIIDNKKENLTEKMKENFNEKIEENIIDNKEENFNEKIEENITEDSEKSMIIVAEENENLNIKEDKENVKVVQISQNNADQSRKFCALVDYLEDDESDEEGNY